MNLKEVFETGYSYSEYRSMLNRLLEEGKTTGPDQSESMLAYAQLNNRRMDRGDKVVKIEPDWAEALDGFNVRENWLVLTEGWCGDASQVLPVFAKIEEAVKGIEMKLILRDEHPDIMDQFLTKGTRSIPKLIRLHPETNEVIGSWGPRPLPMQEVVDEWKTTQAFTKEEMYVQVHGSYARDRGKKVLEEILNEMNQTYAETVK